MANKIRVIYVHVLKKADGWGWELDAGARGYPNPTTIRHTKNFDSQLAAVHAARAGAGKACKARRRRDVVVAVNVHGESGAMVVHDSSFVRTTRKPILSFSPSAYAA